MARPSPLTGKNFSTTATANTVKIGTTAASVTSATATKLVVSVPEGATTGKISVTVDDYTYSSAKTFTVTVPEPDPLNIELNKNQTTLYPYETYKETLSVTSDLEGNTVTWTSDDETVATVDQNGVVTPLKIGEAKITAAAGGGAAECAISVVDGPVTAMELDKTELELFRDETTALEITVLEAAVENTSPAVWSSDNESVATVDQEGNITAIAPGLANIAATVDNKSAICPLTVNPNVYVGGLDFEAGGGALWKNGSVSGVPGIADVYSVFVDDADKVYMTGYGNINNTYYTIGVWDDGAVMDLTDGSTEAYGRSIFVSGKDTYVAGYEFENNITVAKVWRNGVATALTDGQNPAEAYSVYVNGEDVYVAGYEGGNNITVAKVWRNGVATALTDGQNNAKAYSVHVDGKDIYVAGYERENNITVAKVWRNGEVLHTLTNGTNHAECQFHGCQWGKCIYYWQ